MEEEDFDFNFDSGEGDKSEYNKSENKDDGDHSSYILTLTSSQAAAFFPSPSGSEKTPWKAQDLDVGGGQDTNVNTANESHTPRVEDERDHSSYIYTPMSQMGVNSAENQEPPPALGHAMVQTGYEDTFDLMTGFDGNSHSQSPAWDPQVSPGSAPSYAPLHPLQSETDSYAGHSYDPSLFNDLDPQLDDSQMQFINDATRVNNAQTNYRYDLGASPGGSQAQYDNHQTPFQNDLQIQYNDNQDVFKNSQTPVLTQPAPPSTSTPEASSDEMNERWPPHASQYRTSLRGTTSNFGSRAPRTSHGSEANSSMPPPAARSTASRQTGARTSIYVPEVAVPAAPTPQPWQEPSDFTRSTAFSTYPQYWDLTGRMVEGHWAPNRQMWESYPGARQVLWQDYLAWRSVDEATQPGTSESAYSINLPSSRDSAETAMGSLSFQNRPQPRRVSCTSFEQSNIIPWCTDPSLNTEAACREFLTTSDPEETQRIVIADDDWQQIQAHEIGTYAQRIYDALSHDHADWPREADRRDFVLDKYEDQQRNAREEIEKALREPNQARRAQAQCCLLVHAATNLSSHGINKGIFDAYQEAELQAKKAKRDAHLDLNLKCSERLKAMIDIVKSNKMIAKDIVHGKNFDRIAQDPKFYLAEKIKYHQSNAVRDHKHQMLLPKKRAAEKEKKAAEKNARRLKKEEVRKSNKKKGDEDENGKFGDDLF